VIALWLQDLIHLFRSRLLAFIILFSVAVQYFAVKLVKSATLYISFSIQGSSGLIQESESYFVALLASCFAGIFLAAVYGTWIAPYLHRGPRSALTHMLPVSRWYFPAAHALAFAVLLVIQALALVWSLGVNLGWAKVFSADFPLKGIAWGFLLQTLAFYVVLFGTAASSMTLGALPTFFLTYLSCGALTVARALLFFENNPLAEELGATGFVANVRWIISKLPPVGDLLVDMRVAFTKQVLPTQHLALWAIWLVAFVIWFRWRLGSPQKIRSSEG
jgi:hypothetical protein